MKSAALPDRELRSPENYETFKRDVADMLLL